MTGIPKEAIEAARAKLMERNIIGVTYEAMEAVLQAAAPFMQQGFLMYCKTCGTITSDNECDCTAFGDDRAPLQKLMPYTLEELKQSMKADKEYDFNDGIEAAASELKKIGVLSRSGRDLITAIRALKK